MSWNPKFEPKHVVYHRLEKAGLWGEFQNTKKLLMRKPISMSASLAFSEALRRYPPSTASERQLATAKELLQADLNIAESKIELQLSDEEDALSSIPLEDELGPELEGTQDDEDAALAADLAHLAELTKLLPVDSDRDIEFAYRNMGLKNLSPGLFPSVPSWRWYCYARQNPSKFLEKYADRADKRRKEASVGVEKFADDKRHQLSALEKLSRAMRLDVEKTILELKSLHPFEFDAAIRKAGYMSKPADGASSMVKSESANLSMTP